VEGPLESGVAGTPSASSQLFRHSEDFVKLHGPARGAIPRPSSRPQLKLRVMAVQASPLLLAGKEIDTSRMTAADHAALRVLRARPQPGGQQRAR
jgi:hypothetical protein